MRLTEGFACGKMCWLAKNRQDLMWEEARLRTPFQVRRAMPVMIRYRRL
ncbi:MAG: hypothetical protein NT023_21430 [Armatimonadetes bacterium]|nr:hypothetical protein [Armatimonadota bacterium]